MHNITQLSHSFGTTATFQHVDLRIGQGEIVSLLGQSGCGKSTLLRCIAGLETPHHGEITVQNKVVFSSKINVKPGKRNLGLVFQDYALFPALTVRGNVGFGLKNIDEKRIDELLDLVGITQCADRFPHQLSGGQQQRVSLARSLAPKPQLLLLDEPFSNIDAHRKLELGQEIRSIVEHQKISAVFVTHDQVDAFSLADRVAVMTQQNGIGTIAQIDAPHALYSNPISPEVAVLTGPSTFIDGIRIESSKSSIVETCLGKISIQESSISTEKRNVKVLIRPENLCFNANVSGNVVVGMSCCTGPGFQLIVDVGPIRFRIPHPTYIPKGTRGTISTLKPCLSY